MARLLSLARHRHPDARRALIEGDRGHISFQSGNPLIVDRAHVVFVFAAILFHIHVHRHANQPQESLSSDHDTRIGTSWMALLPYPSLFHSARSG
jgi:hypothetical protein